MGCHQVQSWAPGSHAGPGPLHGCRRWELSLEQLVFLLTLKPSECFPSDTESSVLPQSVLADPVATLNSEEESDPPTYKDAFPPLPEKAACLESAQEPAGAWGNKIRPIKASVITQVETPLLVRRSLQGGRCSICWKGAEPTGARMLCDGEGVGRGPGLQSASPPATACSHRVSPQPAVGPLVFSLLRNLVSAPTAETALGSPLQQERVCLFYLLSHCLEAVFSFGFRDTVFLALFFTSLTCLLPEAGLLAGSALLSL